MDFASLLPVHEQNPNCQSGLSFLGSCLGEVALSYHSKQTLQRTIDPDYGNLDSIL